MLGRNGKRLRFTPFAGPFSVSSWHVTEQGMARQVYPSYIKVVFPRFGLAASHFVRVGLRYADVASDVFYASSLDL